MKVDGKKMPHILPHSQVIYNAIMLKLSNAWPPNRGHRSEETLHFDKMKE